MYISSSTQMVGKCWSSKLQSLVDQERVMTNTPNCSVSVYLLLNRILTDNRRTNSTSKSKLRVCINVEKKKRLESTKKLGTCFLLENSKKEGEFDHPTQKKDRQRADLYFVYHTRHLSNIAVRSGNSSPIPLTTRHTDIWRRGYNWI